MNDLDFSFEDSPWEAFLRTKRAGDTVSAANLLTMLEEENEQVVEDALQALEDGGLNLNVRAAERRLCVCVRKRSWWKRA